ncbi:MAG: NADP-dependent malic enzyme, partial [uncultured Rubrobacteraceae bacterium]
GGNPERELQHDAADRVPAPAGCARRDPHDDRPCGGDGRGGRHRPHRRRQDRAGHHSERPQLGPRARDRRGGRGAGRCARPQHLRQDVPHAPRRQDRGALEDADPDPRRPLDGVYAGGREGVPRHRTRPRAGLQPHDQAQHRRGRLRRYGGPRPRGHRSRGRDAGNGGQGHALQGVCRRRRVPDLPRHEGHRGDHRDRQAHSTRVRRHKPRRHLGPALLRDRGAPEEGARDPGLPRRPARHRGRRPRRAHQFPQDRRQGDEGPEGRRERHRCCGRGVRQDPDVRGRQTRSRLRLAGHRPQGPRGPERLQEVVRRAHQPREPHRRPDRGDAWLRPLPRPLGARGAHDRPPRLDERGPDSLRDGEPGAGDHAGGRLRPRQDHGHRALGLPEPDQQRPLFPGHLPRRPRRPRPRDRRRHEARRRPRHRRGDLRRRGLRGLRDPERLRRAGRPRRGRNGRRGRQAERPGPPHQPAGPGDGHHDAAGFL